MLNQISSIKSNHQTLLIYPLLLHLYCLSSRSNFWESILLGYQVLFQVIVRDNGDFFHQLRNCFKMCQDYTMQLFVLIYLPFCSMLLLFDSKITHHIYRSTTHLLAKFLSFSFHWPLRPKEFRSEPLIFHLQMRVAITMAHHVFWWQFFQHIIVVSYSFHQVHEAILRMLQVEQSNGLIVTPQADGFGVRIWCELLLLLRLISQVKFVE